MKWVAAIGAAALVAGVALALEPAFALALVPVLGLPLLVRSAKARLLYTIGGGMVALGSPNIDLPKLIYLAGLVVVVALSLADINPLLREQWFRPFRGVLWGSVLLTLALGFSFLVAYGHGISGGNWLRDALPYLLLVVTPLVAFSAARDLEPQWCTRVIVVVGLLAAVGFATDWLSRRGVSNIPFGRFVFSSVALIVFGFCYALVRSMTGRRRGLWMLSAAVMPASVLITGSRSALVMLAAFPSIIGRRARARVPLQVVVVTAALFAALLWFLVPIIGSQIIANPEFLTSRLEAAQRVISGAADADLSYQARASVTAQASKVFETYPVLGAGLGYRFEIAQASTGRGSVIDSPLGPVAKLGIVGTLLLLGYFALIVRALRLVGREVSDVFFTACWAFVAVFLIQLPFGSFVEDKGLGFSVLLLLAAGAAFARARSNADASSDIAVPGATRQPAPLPR